MTCARMIGCNKINLPNSSYHAVLLLPNGQFDFLLSIKKWIAVRFVNIIRNDTFSTNLGFNLVFWSCDLHFLSPYNTAMNDSRWSGDQKRLKISLGALESHRIEITSISIATWKNGHSYIAPNMPNPRPVDRGRKRATTGCLLPYINARCIILVAW